jgi:hypothetical protein
MLERNLDSNLNGETFKRLADSISRRASRFGKTVRGYTYPDLPLFSAAGSAKQAEILDSLRLQDASLDTEDETVFFEAEKRALWKSIMLLGFVPPPDLFNELKPDRAIEIFGMDGGLIWRNLSCMDLCSYTLEEIACIDVFERYERSPGAYEECVANLQAMLSGQAPEVMDPRMRAYTIVEKLSSERLVLSIKHELGALLRTRQGDVGAWLVMSQAKVVGTNLPPPERRPSHLSVVS